MKVLLKQARIICSSSPLHGQVKDILVTDGRIEQIADQISENAGEIIAQDNLHVSLGWMDIFAHFNDPGGEQNETIETGVAAAAAGGYTAVMLLPNTNPPVSSKSQVEYLVQRSRALAVDLYPIASITKEVAGKELAEMYDMHASGAVAFSDGTQPVQSPGVMLKALQYVLAIQGIVIQLPDDKSISKSGLMNEGIMSTKLGLPGKPAIAEELMIARDIELLKYTGSRLHITGVSTKKGMDLVQAAKAVGLSITCSVTPYHCWFCDEDLAGYDTNLKVDPPLRTREDMNAIRKAVQSGLVDAIASHHLPHHWDDKTCEFEYAKNGMSGLESTFAAMNSMETGIDKLVDMLTVTPRRIFNIPMPSFEIGSKACLTLFDPVATYEFDGSMLRSKSPNNAFVGKQLKGRAIGILNKDQIVIGNK